MVEIKVGPTNCDHERLGRDKWIDSLLSKIKNGNLIDVKTTGAIHASIIFFREALNCYQNGAYAACIAMCGASIENLLLDLTLFDEKVCCKDKASDSYAWSVKQEFKDGQYRNYFRELVSPRDGRYKKRENVLKALKEVDCINEEQGKIINDILEIRDQAVHYTENTFRRWFDGIANKQVGAVHFWPFDKKTAEKTIENVLSILGLASKKFATKL